jgi:hypothetical protein
MGPWEVKINGVNTKMWILVITCLWSRGINLIPCFGMGVIEFLRCLQLHIYQYGLFELYRSDLGSQITAGAKIVTNFIDEAETMSFFDRNGIKKLTFQQYSKGNESLGSLVENMVKQSKRLIAKSIGTIKLNYPDFQLLISKVKHLINRRPIAFKESLRESSIDHEIPTAITPESLLYGRDLPSMNVIPQLQRTNDDSSDDDYNPNKGTLVDHWHRIKVVHERLTDLYHNEFLTQLITQSVDEKDAYKYVKHKSLKVGDLVLVVEKFSKQSNYPLGIVTKVIVNSQSEVTDAEVRKGKTRELVRRHVSSLILLIPNDSGAHTESASQTLPESPQAQPRRSQRLADKVESEVIIH